MKKSLRKISVLLFIFIVLFSGCQSNDQTGGGNQETDVFADTAEETLRQVMEKTDIDVGMTFDEAVTEENCESVLGLTTTEFADYVEEAFSMSAAITTTPHLTAVMKCKDFESAKQVEELTAKGFNSNRWICVVPGESFVIRSGSYVFLASTLADYAEPIKNAFLEAAGETAGEVTVFYEGER